MTATATRMPLPTPVLQPDTLYLAYDRIVCIDCAGMTATYTGLTIGGAPVTPIIGSDVTEWANYGFGPLSCEGKHLTAVADPNPTGFKTIKTEGQ